MSRRKRIVLITVLTLVFVVVGLGVHVTQPLVPSQRQFGTWGEGADPLRLRDHVVALSETFVPRDHLHPANLDSAAAYIRALFAATGGRLGEQVYQVEGRTYRNVSVAYGPEEGKRVVVGAHYDAYGELPGADDNASGVAGLLELARRLEGMDLGRTVELVAYTLEEPPYFRTEHMGSAVHARSLREQDVEVEAMLSLEMIGTFIDTPGSQSFPLGFLKLLYPDEGNWIGVIGDFSSGRLVRRVKSVMARASEVPVHSFNAPPSLVPGIDWSDHLNYRNEGYPAVMITDTAYLRNHHYHTPEDTADRLDYARMAQVVDAVHATVVRLAGD